MNYQIKPGTPEELAHFGVKGMKWGRRKSRTTSSGGSTSTKKTTVAKKSGSSKKVNISPETKAKIKKNSILLAKAGTLTAISLIGGRVVADMIGSNDFFSTTTIDRSGPTVDTTIRTPPIPLPILPRTR